MSVTKKQQWKQVDVTPLAAKQYAATSFGHFQWLYNHTPCGPVGSTSSWGFLLIFCCIHSLTCTIFELGTWDRHGLQYCSVPPYHRSAGIIHSEQRTLYVTAADNIVTWHVLHCLESSRCQCILCDALLTDHPVIGCCDSTATRPSYISTLSRIEPELHGIEVHVCITTISCVKGMLGMSSLLVTFRCNYWPVNKFCILWGFYF